MGFDKKKECDELYKGLKKDYLEKMIIKRIPFVFICAAADDGKKTDYNMKIFGPGPLGLTLSQDYFREALNLFNGFETNGVETVYSKDRSLATIQADEELAKQTPDVHSIYSKEQIESIIGEDALEPITDDTDEADEAAVDQSIRQMLQDTVRKSKEPEKVLPAAEADNAQKVPADAPHFMPPIVNEEALKTMVKDTNQNFSACQFTWEGNEPLIKQDNRAQEQKAYRAINLLCQNIKCGDDSFGRAIEEKLRREQERKDKKLEAEQAEEI